MVQINNIKFWFQDQVHIDRDHNFNVIGCKKENKYDIFFHHLYVLITMARCYNKMQEEGRRSSLGLNKNRVKIMEQVLNKFVSK